MRLLATQTDLLMCVCVETGGGRPTLTRVQVGLVSLARELKHDLDKIAARADTSSSRGLHHLLQGEWLVSSCWYWQYLVPDVVLVSLSQQQLVLTACE